MEANARRVRAESRLSRRQVSLINFQTGKACLQYLHFIRQKESWQGRARKREREKNEMEKRKRVRRNERRKLEVQLQLQVEREKKAIELLNQNERMICLLLCQ